MKERLTKTGFYIEMPCDEYMNTWHDKAVYYAEVEEEPDAVKGTIGSIPTYRLLEPKECAGVASGFSAMRFVETSGPARVLTKEEYCRIVKSIYVKMEEKSELERN